MTGVQTCALPISIKYIEALRLNEKSPIKVYFYYDPNGANVRVVKKAAYEDREHLDSAMVHNNEHRFIADVADALAIIEELKKGKAVDPKLADKITNDINTNTNIGSSSPLFVTRTHYSNSADLPDK